MVGFSPEVRLHAAVITLTEMRFRALTHRILEYCLVLFLLLRGRDPGAVSIGISQLSVRHLKRILGVGNLSALRASMSAERNLYCCCVLASELQSSGLPDLLRGYNGRTSIFYIRAAEAILARLEGLHRATVAGRSKNDPSTRG